MPERETDKSFPLFPGAAGAQPPRPTGGTLTGSAVGQFAIVLRGYDRGQVDVHVNQLETSISELTRRGKTEHAELVQLRDEIESHRREVAEAKRILAETERPTYAGLGTRAQELLRLAEEQAIEIVSGSEAEKARRMGEAANQAGEIRRAAEVAATAVREIADREAAATVMAAEQAGAAMRDAAARAAENERDAADREAQTVREAAAADSDDLRGSADRDVARLRAISEREAAEIRATARGEAEHLRIVVKRETDTLRAEVDQLTEETRHRANEDRSVLDVEIARVRENSERDAAARHDAAVAAASRIMGEAEQRAEDAHRREVAAREVSAQLEADAEHNANAVVAAARNEADSTLASARSRAEEIIGRALAESEQMRAAAEQHADELSRQHDSVQGYFNQLRAVLGSAGGLDPAAAAVVAAAQADGSLPSVASLPGDGARPSGIPDHDGSGPRDTAERVDDGSDSEDRDDDAPHPGAAELRSA